MKDYRKQSNDFMESYGDRRKGLVIKPYKNMNLLTKHKWPILLSLLWVGGLWAKHRYDRGKIVTATEQAEQATSKVDSLATEIVATDSLLYDLVRERDSLQILVDLLDEKRFTPSRPEPKIKKVKEQYEDLYYSIDADDSAALEAWKRAVHHPAD